METTGGDASWINGNNKIHNRSIHTMVREGLVEDNQHEKNCAVQQKHHQKSIGEISIVLYKTPHLNLHVMERNPSFMN